MKVTSAVFVVLVSAFLAGCGGEDEAAPAHTMSGQVAGPECGGGFDLEGSQIVLRDESDDIIGTATTSSNLADPVDSPCVVSFEITDVPRAEFYTITIGSHEGPAWSFSQLEQQDFKPTLGLGSAKVPTASPDDFCSATTEIAAVFDDIDQLNDEPYRWNTRLHGYTAAFESFAAGLAVEGESPTTVQVLLATADVLSVISATDSISAMNRTIKPLNEAMETFQNEFDCPYWAPVNYVPAN